MQAYINAKLKWDKQDPCPECGHNRAAHNQDGCTIPYCKCRLDYGVYDPDPLGHPVLIRAEDALKMTVDEAQEFIDKITHQTKEGEHHGEQSDNTNPDQPNSE
jgi:hypothetical protein